MRWRGCTKNKNKIRGKVVLLNFLLFLACVVLIFCGIVFFCCFFSLFFESSTMKVYGQEIQGMGKK